MKQIALTKAFHVDSFVKVKPLHYLLLFITGLCAPFGFAPFHMPGLAILSVSILFTALLNSPLKQSLILAFSYGMGFFGFGISWVILSIHDYGHLNYLFSAFITLFFIIYLSLFPATVALIFKTMKLKNTMLSAILFSSLWCLIEYLRSNLMTGFPWLLLGTTQMDTPIKYLAPIVGVYGLSFLCVLSAALLSLAMREQSIKRYYFLSLFVILLLSPTLLKNIQWTKLESTPLTVAGIQGNLSMRDKWDETLFRKLLHYYEKATLGVLGNQLVILPESAIPLPANYLQDYLMNLHTKAFKAHSALMLGILQATDESETHYNNAIHAYGYGDGQHLKRHLVPFGEYIPSPFKAINRWFDLPEPNVLPGPPNQPLIKIFNHPIASLICYEIAYSKLLAQQMPEAEWIVSISDNGWFGHSLASYQQLQMAQMLSLLVGRFQVVVNNDGLSSIIDTQGNIVEGLPSFSAGILQHVLFPAHGATPWVYWNEFPVLLLCLVCVIIALIYRICHFDRQ